VTRSEIQRIQQYLRETFGTARITVHGRQDKADSAEVNLGGEFVGVIFRDDEESDISYDFHMTILDIDLPPGP
jgi:hypothetical protein